METVIEILKEYIDDDVIREEIYNEFFTRSVFDDDPELYLKIDPVFDKVCKENVADEDEYEDDD